MKIYTTNMNENRSKINIKDLVFMFNNIDDMLKVYTKSVWIINEEQREAINKLREIVEMFRRKQFDELFEDHLMDIDFTPDTEKITRDELKAWHEFFRKNPFKKGV